MNTPPEHWPQAAVDDVELLLKRLALAIDREMGALRYAHPDATLDWDKEPARSWIMARLESRLFTHGAIQL